MFLAVAPAVGELLFFNPFPLLLEALPVTLVGSAKVGALKAFILMFVLVVSFFLTGSKAKMESKLAI